MLHDEVETMEWQSTVPPQPRVRTTTRRNRVGTTTYLSNKARVRDWGDIAGLPDSATGVSSGGSQR